MATVKSIPDSGITVKHKKRSKWQEAINHLEAQLRRTSDRKRADQLRSAITTFRANLARGIEWPATQD
jgi:hypothetical protein